MNKIQLILLTTLSAIFVCGCLPSVPTENDRQEWRTKDIQNSVYTIEHDGHKFVVITRQNGVAMLHHPSCPCLKKTKIEKVENDK